MQNAAVLSILVNAKTGQATTALRKTQGQLKQTEKAAGRTGKGFKGLSQNAKLAIGSAAGAGLLGLAGVAKSSVGAFREQQRVTKDTAAVLKSMGHGAGLTAKEVEALAGSISRKTGVDDEAIQKSQNLLLTFGDVRNEVGKGNDVFNRASKAVVDMSARFDQGLKPSVTQLGKALQDPIRGITALRRVGLDFTQSEQDKIKVLVESGKKLEAQKMIMAAVEKQTRGSAAAQATAMDKLKVTLGNVSESIGSFLVPALDKGARVLDKFIGKVQGILGDKNLTGKEKFQRLSDMLGQAVSSGLSKAADAAAKAAPKVASAFGRGFVSWWYQAAPLAKIFGVAALIRVFGGKGAITAAGAAVGRLLGGGIAAGAATGAVSGAAGGAAGGAAAGGIFGAMRGKLLPLARKAGLAGVGIVLADSVISEFGRQTAARGPDLMKALEASSSPGFTSKVGNVALGPFGAKFGEGDRNKVKALKDILESTKGITAEQAKQAQNAIGLTKLDDQQAAQVRKMLKVRQEAGRIFGKGVSLKANIDPSQALKAMDSLERGSNKLKNRLAGDTAGIARISGQNLRHLATLMNLHSRAGQQAVTKNMRLTAGAIRDKLKAGEISASSAMKGIRKAFSVHSRASKETAQKNFGLAKGAIQGAVRSGAISAEEGLREIKRLFMEYLGAFGVKGRDAEVYMQGGDNKGGDPSNRRLPFARGGRLSGGTPHGDSIPAVLERGEYVLNRRAVQAIGPRQLDAVNFAAAPRFREGGRVPRQMVGGPGFGGIQPGVQGGLDANVRRANELLKRAKEEAAAAAPVPTGGGRGPKGTVPWPGLSEGIATWVAGALGHAIGKGVAVSPTSGYRSPAHNAAVGGATNSQHMLTQYPGGAVDFGGFTTGLAMKMAVVNATRDYKYPLLAPIGFRDDGHASGTGHQRGGLIGMQSGGAARRYPGAGFNWAYKNYPAHGGGGAALSVKQVRQVAEMAGFSPGRAVQMAQIARGESTYKPGADGGMYGTPGPPGYGLWQITPGAWGGTGREAIYNKFHSLGSRKGMFTPIKNAKMAKFMYGQSGFGPWVGTQYLDRGMNVSGVSSVLGANARSGGGGGEPATPMSKRNRKILKRIPKRLKKIKGIGLGKKREGYLAHLNNLNAYYAEYAGRANSLGTTVGETDVRGKAGGHDEAYWLSQQLLTLWQLRETLIKYEAVIVKKRDRTTEMIESAKKFLRKLNKHPRRNKALIKAYKTRVIPALKKARSGLNTRRGELLGDEGLAGIQGIGSPMKSLKWQKPYGTTLGTLGGTFLEVQKNLRDLNAPAVTTPPTPPEASTESADLLRQLLREANLRTAVGQNEIANLPFAGSFAQGGIVPGRGPMAAVVHGGEAIGQPGSVSVQVFVHPNGQGADVYVNEKKVEAVVEKVTRNMARKVGRAPGARG